MLKRFIVGLLILFFSVLANALPICTPVVYKKEDKTFILPGTKNPKASVVYFFKNKSTRSIWIDHPIKKNPGASAGWASYIRPGNWSALAMNKKNFAISCVMIQPGKVIYLDCAQALEVCAPNNLVSEKKLKGNYWLVEDKPFDVFTKALEKRGARF